MSAEKDFVKTMPKSKGKGELLRHLNGDRLTLKQAIIAKWYDCCGYFQDGKKDCEIPECPLCPFMPYRKGGAMKIRAMSDEQRERMALRLMRGSRQADLCAGER